MIQQSISAELGHRIRPHRMPRINPFLLLENHLGNFDRRQLINWLTSHFGRIARSLITACRFSFIPIAYVSMEWCGRQVNGESSFNYSFRLCENIRPKAVSACKGFRTRSRDHWKGNWKIPFTRWWRQSIWNIFTLRCTRSWHSVQVSIHHKQRTKASNAFQTITPPDAL